MAAVIGTENSIIEEVCNKLKKEGKFVTPANYNYYGQTVISGEKKAIEEATEILKEQGIKRIIPLKTSGPFHTEKLDLAKAEYEKELEKVTFNKGKVEVIKNIDGTIYNENDDIKKVLANHIVSPVRFDKAIKYMFEKGVTEFVEIGPGKVLTGFIKKEDKEANVVNTNNLESLENYCCNL